jgi:hypothetical protein
VGRLAALLAVASGCAKGVEPIPPAPRPVPETPPTKRDVRPAVVPGTYALDNDSFGATLVIPSVAPLKFSLLVVGKRPSAPHGVLHDELAEVVDEATAVAAFDEDCRLTFRFARGRIDVVQDGGCREAGFGAFVSAAGQYLRVSSSTTFTP